jgi:Site-specific recombinase XerD
MASIRRHPRSKYFHACITLPDGRQTQRSTKLTDAKKALKFANLIEEAIRGPTLLEHQARKIISEIYSLRNTGASLPGTTARDFLSKWIENKARETAESTASSYRNAICKFLGSLGPKADRDLNEITRSDVIGFRDAVAQRLSATSANQAVKVVRSILKDALVAELVDRNVAVGVKRVKHRGEANARRPFTLPELKKILGVVKGTEWEGLILFGIYTGQRLRDIADLTWANLDLDSSELVFVSRKTGRRMRIPLAAPLQHFIEKLPALDDPKAPLFSRASNTKRTGTLSNQFYDIMVDAGLVEPRNHRPQGIGRSSERAFNSVGFHALRHTATSLMKNAGISPAIVQDIIGHDSAAISAAYTHVSESAKRKALNAMPDVL